MKRDQQGSRRKTAKFAGPRAQVKQLVNGEMLRSAVTWIVDEKIFHNLKVHGNTKWLACDLIWTYPRFVGARKRIKRPSRIWQG